MTRPLDVGGNEGRDYPESYAASRACLVGLLHWILAPFRWMRLLNFGEWMAILMVFVALWAAVERWIYGS